MKLTKWLGSPQNVLLAWVVVVLSHFTHFIQEVFGTVYKLILIGTFITFLHRRVLPQSLSVLPELRGVVEICGRALVQDELV